MPFVPADKDSAWRQHMKKLILGSALLASVGACASLNSAVNSAAGTLAPVTNATALRQDMRKLWSDHVVWTRGYIVAAVAGDPSSSVALTRLMKNQEDIGN